MTSDMQILLMENGMIRDVLTVHHGGDYSDVTEGGRRVFDQRVSFRTPPTWPRREPTLREMAEASLHAMNERDATDKKVGGD